MTSVAFARFINALRIMRALDEHEIKGIEEWSAFRHNPYLYLMRASIHDQRIIWQAINKRQPDDLRLGPAHMEVGR